jgi:hypothetical protein
VVSEGTSCSLAFAAHSDYDFCPFRDESVMRPECSPDFRYDPMFGIKLVEHAGSLHDPRIGFCSIPKVRNQAAFAAETGHLNAEEAPFARSRDMPCLPCSNMGGDHRHCTQRGGCISRLFGIIGRPGALARRLGHGRGW